MYLNDRKGVYTQFEYLREIELSFFMIVNINLLMMKK